MAFLYVRVKQLEDGTNEFYAGRTHHDNVHNRRDSGHHGVFATDMDNKELAIKVSEEEIHFQESEAIQALYALVGRDHCGNRTQLYQPETGWQWDYYQRSIKDL